MPTINELVRQCENELEDAERQETQSRHELRDILATAERENRATLRADEAARSDQLFNSIEHSRAAVRRARTALERAREAQADEARIDAQQRDVRDTGVRPASRTGSFRVGSEQQVYRAPAERGTGLDRDGGEPSFLSDLYSAQVRNDPAALTRLERHGRQVLDEQPAVAKQLRSFGTSVVPGFAPPQYLVDAFAKFARAGRPTANLCSGLPLPSEGMTVNIPRVTTATATGVQTAENANLTNQDPATTLLTVNVNTIGGYVVASRQALERGTILEPVVMADLAADYNSKLDLQVLNGSGASGQHLGILGVSGTNLVTYTDATPTVPELLPKTVLAMQNVWQNRFAGPTAFVTSPKAWAWILAQVDTQGRPLVEPSGVAMNPTAIMDSSNSTSFNYAPAGSLFNLPVYVDANLLDNFGAGTNESRIIVANWDDLYLFEDANGAPVQLRFEAPSAQSLGVLLVAYGYSAFAAGRQPKAISVVAGTGLIVPAL
jgi:HK97 family phage major capsid protein